VFWKMVQLAFEAAELGGGLQASQVSFCVCKSYGCSCAWRHIPPDDPSPAVVPAASHHHSSFRWGGNDGETQQVLYSRGLAQASVYMLRRRNKRAPRWLCVTLPGKLNGLIAAHFKNSCGTQRVTAAAAACSHAVSGQAIIGR
jgi:hypothetical protein